MRRKWASNLNSEFIRIGSDPTYMLLGPVLSTEKALFKARFSVEDIDVFEINEAFASVVLSWQKETNVPSEKINPYGGAIVLGHPLGASGARLMITMLQYLERTGGKYGLQAMCEGNGMANATIIERLVNFISVFVRKIIGLSESKYHIIVDKR